jgi:hypothetical protein
MHSPSSSLISRASTCIAAQPPMEETWLCLHHPTRACSSTASRVLRVSDTVTHLTQVPLHLLSPSRTAQCARHAMPCYAMQSLAGIDSTRKPVPACRCTLST